MAGADYNGLEAVFRVAEAGEKPATFAIEVLTFHAAVEHELEEVLRRLMPHPDKLLRGKPKPSFAIKARLLSALWKGDPADADKLNEVLKAFQDLRDAIAHTDDEPLKSHKARLTQAYRAIDSDAEDDPSMMTIAQGICVFFGDEGWTLGRMTKTMEFLDKLVNQMMPKALGTSRDREKSEL